MRASSRARIAQICSASCPLCSQRSVSVLRPVVSATLQSTSLSTPSSLRNHSSPTPNTFANVQVRHASSLTTLSSFASFFKRNPSRTSKISPKTLRKDVSLEEAVTSGDVKAVTTVYRKLAEAARRSNDPSEAGVTQDTLDMALSLLAKSSSMAPESIFKQVIEDYASLFGWTYSTKARRAILQFTCTSSTPEAASEEIRRMQQDCVEVSLHDWNAVIRCFSAQGRGLSGLKLMKEESGIRPDIQTYSAILRDLSKEKDVSIEDIDVVLEDMKSTDIEPDESTTTILLRAFDRAGQEERLAEWTTRLESRAEGGELSLPSWSILLFYIGRLRGFQAALEMFRRMEENGIRPDGAAMSNLVIIKLQEQPAPRDLSAAEAINLVYDLERETGLKADKRVWTVILRATLGTSHHMSSTKLTAAIAVYDEAIAAAVQPDPEMVESLIVGLCEQPGKGYAKARKIYRDLVGAEEDAATIKSGGYISESRTRSQQEAMSKIHFTLLFKCVNAGCGIADCIEYLDEMRRLGIAFKRNEAASLIVRLMGAANDHYEAFKLYSYGRALDTQGLNAEGYSDILVAFSHLSFPTEMAAPPKLFFELIHDMRRAGYIADAKIYTELISTYTKLLRRRQKAGKMSFKEEEGEERVIEALRRVHANLKLDSFVEMDIPLLNALMDAYNQVSAWGECNEIWEEILARRPYEEYATVFQPSLNIILDACGYAGAVQKARSIWGWASNGGIPLNRANHEAWIECLCRLGQTMEATRIVCQEYRIADGVATPRPDDNMLAVLLKFCWRNKETYRQVPKMVKESFPEKWDDVKHIVETKRALKNSPQDGEGVDL